MESNNIETAPVRESTTVAKVVVTAINRNCTDILNGVKAKFQNLKRENDLSIEPEGSVLKEESFVDGSFVGVFKFVLVYRKTCDSDEKKYKVVQMIESICERLEELAPTLVFDANRSIESIEQTTNVSRRAYKDNSAEDYFCRMTLRYEYKEE